MTIEPGLLRAVTRGEVDSFESDGFVVLPRVLSARELSPLYEAVERILASSHVRDVTEEAARTAVDPDTVFGATPYSEALGGVGHFRISHNTARWESTVQAFVLSGGPGSI